MAAEAHAAPPRSKGALNQRLVPQLPPIALEVASLLDLKTTSRAVRPGQEVVSEGRRCSAVLLVLDGILIRYRILRDGQRQILNFVLPGDFVGATSCRFDAALHSVKTLTPTTVAPIPLATLVAFAENHPRTAARLFWSFACEAAILAEHLIAVGRRSAIERVAHLLLELLSRLQEVGLAGERSYQLPLTQELISDALGLSIPYVNRILQQLRLAGLVTLKDQQVVIQNFDELAVLADFERAYLRPLSIGELLPQQAERGTA